MGARRRPPASLNLTPVVQGQASAAAQKMLDEMMQVIIGAWHGVREAQPDAELDLVALVNVVGLHGKVQIHPRLQLLDHPSARGSDLERSAWIEMRRSPLPPATVRDAIWVVLLNESTGEVGLLAMGWPKAMQKTAEGTN